MSLESIEVEEIPLALPVAKRNKKIQIPLDTLIDQKWKEKMEKEEELKGLDWIIRLEFSPSVNEKQLWNCFESLLSFSYPHSSSSLSKDSNSFPGSIKVYGKKEEAKKAKRMFGRRMESDEDQVIPLFSPKFFEEIESNSSNKKRKSNSYSMVIFTTRLVNPSFIPDEENEEEEQEEGEEVEGEEKEGEVEGEQDFNDNYEEEMEPEMISGQELSSLLDQVTNLSKNIGSKCEIICEEPPKEAGERVERILEMLEICDHPTVLEILWKSNEENQSQGGFRGFDIYSTLIEMGFQFDSERNQFILDIAPLLMKKRRSETIEKQSNRRISEEEEEEMEIATIDVVAGGLEKFTLESLSSPTGKFRSVLFEMFLPHCTFPFATIKTMIWAAIQFQKKLGGQIVDYARESIPFSSLVSEDLSVNPLGNEANQLIQRIKSCNLQFGEESLLQLFC